MKRTFADPHKQQLWDLIQALHQESLRTGHPVETPPVPCNGGWFKLRVSDDNGKPAVQYMADQGARSVDGGIFVPPHE